MTAMSELYNPEEKTDILQCMRGLRKIGQIKFDQHESHDFLSLCGLFHVLVWSTASLMVSMEGLAEKFGEQIEQIFSAVSIPQNIMQSEHLPTYLWKHWLGTNRGWCTYKMDIST